jgi:hypothetical protein
MVDPLTPKPTRKTEVLVKVTPTIASRREEDSALKEVVLQRYRCANGILETRTKDGSTAAKAPAPRTNPNTKEYSTAYSFPASFHKFFAQREFKSFLKLGKYLFTGPLRHNHIHARTMYLMPQSPAASTDLRGVRAQSNGAKAPQWLNAHKKLRFQEASTVFALDFYHAPCLSSNPLSAWLHLD